MNVISKRVLNEAKYILKTKYTIRQIAEEFMVSKSTVHVDLNIRLKKLDYSLYHKVKQILIKHLEERHIRGGESTRKKYEKLT